MTRHTTTELIFTRQELFSIIDDVAQLDDNEKISDVTFVEHDSGVGCISFTITSVAPAKTKDQTNENNS